MTTTQQTKRDLPAARLDATDPRHLFGRAVAVATATIAAVEPDQLDLPTPCAELDVTALLGHLVGVLNRAAAMGRGEDAMAVPETIDGADVVWDEVWADAATAAEEAWRDDAALARTVVLPWATLPAGAALLGYLNEVVVHTWDLARATGQHPSWDDDVVAAAFAAISAVLPADGRSELFERMMAAVDTSEVPDGFAIAPFAEAVAVGPYATPIDRLVAYNGREPS